MIIKSVHETHSPTHAIETMTNPQTAVQVEESFIAQETLKPVKGLPNVFTLHAHAKKSSKKDDKRVKDKNPAVTVEEIREYLLYECWRMNKQSKSIYSSALRAGGYHKSMLNDFNKKLIVEITDYLKSFRDPIADNLLKEIKDINFEGFLL